jgi:hypothetical protein
MLFKKTIPEGYDVLSLLEFSERPGDLQKIAIWLTKRGEILCSPQQLEINWIFFSNKFYSKNWVEPKRSTLKEFVGWNNGLERKP